jgi:hypothetical protein
LTYFNTTRERGQKLEQYEAQTECQEGKILEWFHKNQDVEATPWEVWEALFTTTGVPIWSVRRAITNLTDVGGLEQTGKKKPSGPYNRSSLIWRLPSEPGVIEQPDLFR